MVFFKQICFLEMTIKQHLFSFGFLFGIYLPFSSNWINEKNLVKNIHRKRKDFSFTVAN